MPLSPSSDNLLLGNYACYLAELDGSGLPMGERHVGNASAISLQVEPDILEKNERMTSARGLYKQVARQTKMSLKLTLDEITIENLQLGVLGSAVAFGQSNGGLTNHEISSAPEQGLYYATGKRNISDVTVQWDGDPMTEGTDYTVDAANGRIYVVPGGAIGNGAALTVSCDYAETTSRTVRLGTDPNLRRYVRLVGDPTTGATHDYEFWNVQLSPDGELALISDEFASIGLTGAVTLDSTNHPNEPFGRAIERVAA